MLLTIVESTIHATVSLALTTGPHQPEYTSYEQPGATDMVNLLTGDFTFSLPILEVPGPEGGFSVPLTYNAGIGVDQEASWVGLGWTLNVGAITRSIVQYPDDASGEVQSVTQKDLEGVRGWTSNALGFGQIGWNTQVGHYGSISLFGLYSLTWDNSGITSAGTMGFNFSSSGVSFDPVQFMDAAFTIATFGVGGAAKIGTQIAISIGTQVAMSYVAGNQTPNAPTDGYWEYSKRTSSGFLGMWEDYWIWLDQTRNEQMLGVLNFDKARLDAGQFGRSGDLYSPLGLYINGEYMNRGSIYEYGKAGNTQGVASDVSYYLPSNVSYKDSNSPVTIASDNYSVKAPSISGSIKPYRLEVGSVSTPRQMTQFHRRLAVLPHLAYKVPFIYEGANSNRYFYQVGHPTSTNVNSPTFYYGLSAVPRSTNPMLNNFVSLNLNDATFGSGIRPDISSTKKIPMANHVEWLSNNEISSGNLTGMMDYFTGSDRIQFRQAFGFGPRSTFYYYTPDFTNGRIYLSAQEISSFVAGQSVDIRITAYAGNYDWATGTGNATEISISRVPITINSSTSPYYIDVDVSGIYGSIVGKTCDVEVSSGYPKRSNSMGGFAITAVNGLTYHFALPIYEYNNYTKIAKAISPTSPSTTKYSIVQRNEPFANTWLLTGITGPDFVDREGNGTIDENDWGYWVKFNYGKYSDDYEWSIPYDENNLTPNADATSFTLSKGHRQTYYLNSIETRTHVALFVKDTRNDGRGKNIGIGNNGKTLLLKEIELLNRQDYKKLLVPASQGGFGVPTDTGLANLNRCWMMTDFFALSGSHPPQGSYIVQNAIRRIRFAYSYDLCQGTPNSIAANGGKLTLTRVSMIGKNDAKTAPDYKFDYSNNPAYGSNKWDGWGMYSSSGTSAYDSHQASNNNLDGSAWSLTKITNPLGSTIEINYERDTYSSISGKRKYQSSVVNFSTGSFSDFFSGGSSCGTIRGVSNVSQFQVGEVVQIDGYCSYSGYGYFPPGYQLGTGTVNNQSYSRECVITAIDNVNNLISVGVNFRNIQYCLTGNPITINSDWGNIKKLITSQPGGNIRVASLVLNDQTKQMKTRYIYNDVNGVSCGVVAREPEYIKTQDYGFYELPGYPFTPVMYSKITALTGRLTSDSDYHTKQVYEFETPDQGVVVNSGTSDINFTQVGFNWPATSFTRSIRNQISDYTSKIGKLKSVKTYDKLNTLVSSSTMIYSDPTSNTQILNRNSSTGVIENNYQGIFAEGTLVFDRIEEFLKGYHLLSRTTVLKYPYELVKVVNTKDGFTSETENNVWDFTTGIVTEKTEKSPQGSFIKKVTKLAHTVPAYAEMGSKALSPNNKNMLGHEAANYTYQLDASGNPIGLLSASAQTWKSDWANYRYLDANGNYVQGSEGSPNVWRKHQSWVYKGNYADLRTDGSLNFTSANEFKFTPPPPPADPDTYNSGWQKAGEVTRYNHYSEALEGKDMNNIFSASKKDITAYQTLASASNANYFEFAYSGAEDWPAAGTGLYLGGEVAKGAGSPVYKTAAGNETHTGQVALQLGAGQKGFVYKPGALQPGRTYRLSAWTNSPSGALYYNLNGGGEQTILATPSMLVNGWYQVNAQFIVPASFASLEVGVKSTSGVASFDDFRFQPLDGALTANVYDPVTGNVTFTLDNQNMFTQYEYNDRGQLIKTYSESFKYGVKLVSESKMNYRRFNANQ